MTSSIIHRHPASFRDPLGTVFFHENRIVRGLTADGFQQFTAVKQTGLLQQLEQSEKLIKSKEIDLKNFYSSHTHYLEHEVIPFISYPYEWPFTLLKSAALLHLSVQLEALNQDIVLQDASAYNIQFKGISPIFIDVLSFRPYQTGELWGAHRQFCEQFLNPLLLAALKGISYQEWYRGSLEGITTDSLARLMPFKNWFSWRSLVHVLLPARMQTRTDQQKIEKIKKSTISKAVYISFLEQLQKWINELIPYKQNPTTWENYTSTRLYADEEVITKKQFIIKFVNETKPNMLWDFGCNDGEFAELALTNGAHFVIGFDVDLGALEKAIQRAKTHNLNFLPLYQQMTNPSPKQGWLLSERTDALDRGKPDALVALAFIHHLAIAHNIPLREVVHWFIDLAPTGVIEFVQKTDPTVKKMLALKGDIFPDYSEEAFTYFLKEKADIVHSLTISQSGRSLYWYQRK